MEKDTLWNECSFHDNVKHQISKICHKLGYDVREEFTFKDWRADVLVLVNGIKYAFEVQITKQSMEKTQERQKKYLRDDVIGCWLFEKEPKQQYELENLPLFKISNDVDLSVSLKDRKSLPLEVFVTDFIGGKIKFCHIIDAQALEIRFLEMKCWKCGHLNHIYYLGDMISSCNAKILHADIEMWQDNKFIFDPEIVKEVSKHVMESKFLDIGEIKTRYSGTTGTSYQSFGCSKCDSIFGDWFVNEAIMQSLYDDCVIDKFVIHKKNLKLKIDNSLPHWCHPGNKKFCE